MNLFLILLINQFTLPYEIKTFVTSDIQYIIYTRFYQEELISIDSIVPLPTYLSAGLKKKNQKSLLKELQSDLIKKGGYANKGLFGTFEVPLPKGGFSDFMGETGKLDVGGYIKITLGGTETFYSNLPADQQRTSLLPELKMEQEMAVNLDGEVGDRMKVFIDHNSTRVDENENKIRVTYKGKEDEILQELEGGDTQLSIPGTSYTGDIPSHQGLFGLKSTAKLGPVDIVAIASREQTQFSEQEITGGAESMPDTIWARDYQKRQFFWLGTSDSIIELRVYIDDGNPANNNNGITRYAYAYLDLNDDNIPEDSTEKEEGFFTLKYEGPDQDYQFFGRRVNIIELKNSLYNNIEALGVYYRKINSQGKEDTVGFIGSDTFRLKLICPRTFRPTSLTWKYYELKNYYRIGGPGGMVDTIRIYHNVANGIDEDIYQNRTLLSILGLDNDNNNVVDPYNGYGGFDFNRGLLIFPEPTPFVNNNLPEPDSEVYTNPYYTIGPDKYYIYTKSVQVKRIFNIPFNSKRVKVYINDVLIDSTQYVVNYDEGKLEFLRPLSVTDRIRIQAEYTTLFSASQKSLIGLRANSKIFGEGNLGSSFFYRTESYQTAPYEHIRLNEEPYNRMVWEADFALPGKIPYLTELIDNLPLIQTEAESKFNINFEGAYSFSNINSQNAVYLDDFEATTINHSVTLTKNYWHLCSKPVNQDTGNFAKKRIIWYNPPSRNVFKMEDIYNNPTDPKAIAEVLQIQFTPDNPQSFAGLTQYITNTNLDECENIELIVNGTGGKIHIEIAEEISEDQLRRNKKGELVGLNTFEDEDNAPRNFSWDAVNEDRGLDNVAGKDAQNVSGDDGNDDYIDEDYSGGINGTEGNRIWDTEDIDRNGIFNLNSNIYHSFSVHLDSTRFLVEGGLKDGWKMFRIPLKDSLARDTAFGTINWQNIKFVRIWFDNFSKTEVIYIHKLSLTGSRWKNYGIIASDSLYPVDTTEKFVITPVNTETHTYYQPPYPLPIDPITGKTINEGGLEFNLLNVKENHTCIAYRRIETQEDYRSYDTLVFYFRTLHSNPEIALRFGSDSNYYEYKTNYETGVLGYNNWRKYTVILANFPELKKKTGGIGKFTEGSYTVSGNPSLETNRFFEIRITNKFATSLTDTMWFNDIKLTSPKYEIGRIFRSNGSLNIADLSSIIFAYSESNGKFKRLSESKNISTSGPGRDYGINSMISLDKILPTTWGFSIPLGLSYNKNIQEPRYSSTIASDIELDDSSRTLEKSMSTVRGYNISLSKTGSRNWLMKQTLDNLRFSNDRTISISNGPKNADTSDLRNYRGEYSLGPKASIRFYKQQISLLPQTISFSSLYTENLIKSYRRDSLSQPFNTSPGYPQHRKTITPSFSTSYSPHQILSTSYNFSQTRDSVSEKWRFGEEVNRSQTFNSRISKDLIILNPSLQFTANYNEDHRFELRKPYDRRGINNASNISISTIADIKKVVKFLTHLRDESKDSLQIPGSPLWVVKQIETFVDLIQNPSISFSRQKSSGYYSKLRPDLKYQFGLVDTIPSDQIDPNSYSSRSITDNFSAGSGINYKIFSLNGSYSKQINRSFGYSGGENRSVTESYPGATLRISSVEKIPMLKKYAYNSSINTGLNQNYMRLYRVSPDTIPELTSDSKTLSFNPLLGWQVNWKRGITTNANINYSETQNHQYSDMFINPSKSVNWGGSMSFAYTFSAPKGISLPLLRGIRFASNLTTNITYSYNRNTSYAASIENPNNLDMDNPVADNENSNIDISFSYNFSTSITGGANLNYSRNQDRVFNNSYRRVGLNIWANINF
ncbi:MAG: hypothetical protein ABIL02_01760 [candidate division WOR-3 bacterium]